MVLRVILKGILKAYFRLINSLMKSQSNFGKLAIKYKMRLRLFLFLTSGTQNIWYIAQIFCTREEKISKFIPDRKYITASYPSEHF